MALYDPTVADRKRRLTGEQLGTAILWLENNEGDEREDCQAVADWLKVELNRRATQRVARENNVPVKTARAALHKIAETEFGA